MKSPLPEADLIQVGQPQTATDTEIRRFPRLPRLPARLRFGLPLGRLHQIGRTAADGIGRVGRPANAALGRIPRPVFGVMAALVVLLAAVLSGTVQGTDATFVVMGFDWDRAHLITTLIVSAIAAASATLLIDRPAAGALIGTAAVAAMFGPTFVTETQNALAATGALGSFDPVGWILTLVTLVVIGFVSAWAGSTLAAAVRPPLIATGGSVLEMVRSRRPSRSAARRPVAAILVLILFAVTGPVFGDMVNLAPDSLMLNGGQFVPLAPGNSVSIPSVAPTTSETATPAASPSASSSSELAAASPSPGPTTHASPGTKPWLAWKPTGAGKVTQIDFFAPWTGGTADTVGVNIYTPAGYDSDPSRRYPVLYEAPTGLALWGKGTGVIAALDQMIGSGAMPASIVVFIDSAGAPYPDSQCADSYDKKMWLETFISKDVVLYLDTHFRTIKDPNARGIMGMSAGGFCSAMLLTRHPDVFSTAISFSGYFYAGNGSASASAPYGRSQAAMDAVSPAIQVAYLTEAQKARLYYVVIAQPAQYFYATQAQLFEKILKENNVAYDKVDSLYEHSWTQVRNDFPTAVQAWAARLVVDGVW